MAGPEAVPESELEVAWQALHDNTIADAVGLLPKILGTGCAPGASRDLRVHALCAASAIARAWPESPPGMAVDFGRAAREAAHGDPDLAPGAAFRYGHALLADGDVRNARHEARVARYGLAKNRIYGALCLLEAVALFQDDPTDTQWVNLLDAASLCAAMIPEDSPDPWHTEFCAANVAAHRIHLLVRAGRYGEAQMIVTATDFSGLSPERQVAVKADIEALATALACSLPEGEPVDQGGASE